MTLPKVGEMLPAGSPGAGHRDAQHWPCILCWSKCFMILPGEPVKLIDAEAGEVIPQFLGSEFQGIADPFLPGPVTPGTLFWVYPRPALVGAVSHRWELTLPGTLVEPVSAESLPREEDDGDDSACAGCYGGEAEEEDDACKGCYT